MCPDPGPATATIGIKDGRGGLGWHYTHNHEGRHRAPEGAFYQEKALVGTFVSSSSPHRSPTQVLITLCAAVAAVSAAPRYLVIPIEDVDMSVFSGQTLPVYRVPGLARTARMAQEEDSYQSAPAPYDSQVSGADRHASDD